MLINPTQHRRDNCQKHCHYGCYDRRETFIDLEFDALLFEQFFFCVFLLPFSQMACLLSVGFNQIVLFDYVYIITRNYEFVNSFTSQNTNYFYFFLTIISYPRADVILSKLSNLMLTVFLLSAWLTFCLTTPILSASSF